MRLHNLLLLIWFFLAHVHVVKVNKHIFLIIKAIRPDYAQYTSDESEIDEDEAKNDDPDTDTEFDPFAKIESIIAPRKRFSKVLDYSAVANLRSTMLLEVDTISVIRSKLGDSALIIPVSPPFKVKGKSEASNIAAVLDYATSISLERISLSEIWKAQRRPKKIIKKIRPKRKASDSSLRVGVDKDGIITRGRDVSVDHFIVKVTPKSGGPFSLRSAKLEKGKTDLSSLRFHIDGKVQSLANIATHYTIHVGKV
jgi:hypothetical protein